MNYRKEDLTNKQQENLLKSEIEFSILLTQAHELFKQGRARELHETIKQLEKISFRFYMASDD